MLSARSTEAVLGKLSLIYSCTVPRSADLQGAEPPEMEVDQGMDGSCM